MFKDREFIKQNAVLIADPIQLHLYLKEMTKYRYLIETKKLSYPAILTPSVDTNNNPIIIIEKAEDYKNQFIEFYKLIKKDFVKNLILERNERNILQKDIKKTLASVTRHKGFNLIQSAIDKNKYIIKSYNITIDFLFGNYNCYLNSYLRASINKVLT